MALQTRHPMIQTAPFPLLCLSVYFVNLGLGMNWKEETVPKQRHLELDSHHGLLATVEIRSTAMGGVTEEK